MIRGASIAVLLVLLTARPGGGDSADPLIVLETEVGEIEVVLFADRAPVTVANFFRYVDEERFEGAAFYRTVRLDNQPDQDIRIEVIQGGLGFEEHPRRLPAILHETTDKTGVLHLDGALSMARSEPGSASSEFFICTGDQPELDFGGRRNPDGQGFAAFGRVTAGMEVVRRIQERPSRGQLLEPKVKILRVYRRQ